MAKTDPESLGEPTADVIDLAERRSSSIETSVDLSEMIRSSRVQSIAILEGYLVELDACEKAPNNEQKEKQEKWVGIMRQSGFRTLLDPEAGGYAVIARDDLGEAFPTSLYAAARKAIRDKIELLSGC